MKQLIVSAVLIFSATAVFAAVEIHTATDFPTQITKIAIAPIPCPADLACAKVEKALNKSVKKQFPGVAVITTEEINQALFDENIAEANKEAIIAVARKLGCDAILLPAVVGSNRKDHWNTWTDYKTGQNQVFDAASVASTVQILIITLDGKMLLKGQASGESYLQTDQTYFAEYQFDKILRKATK